MFSNEDRHFDCLAHNKLKTQYAGEIHFNILKRLDFQIFPFYYIGVMYFVNRETIGTHVYKGTIRKQCLRFLIMCNFFYDL